MRNATPDSGVEVESRCLGNGAWDWRATLRTKGGGIFNAPWSNCSSRECHRVTPARAVYLHYPGLSTLFHAKTAPTIYSPSIYSGQTDSTRSIQAKHISQSRQSLQSLQSATAASVGGAVAEPLHLVLTLFSSPFDFFCLALNEPLSFLSYCSFSPPITPLDKGCMGTLICTYTRTCTFMVSASAATVTILALMVYVAP
jgi:hypothetical protein